MLEPLESRIAPATLTGNTLSYTDIDGDLVTIKFTTGGELSAGNFVFSTGGVDGSNATPQQLQTIQFSGAEFEGTSMKMKVQMPVGGWTDSQAHIGAVLAENIDLKNVILKGDLGRIVCGSADADFGIKKLDVFSTGTQGISTQEAGGNLTTTIFGGAGAILVRGDFKDAYWGFTGNETAPGNVGSFIIGGDLIGGTASPSGYLTIQGNVGFLEVRGSILGGSTSFTGSILVEGKIGTFHLGGDLAGTVGESGRIIGEGGIKKILIDGKLLGGGSEQNTFVISGGNTKVAKIGGFDGSVNANNSGLIIDGNLKKLVVAGDVQAGDGPKSGYISVGGNLNSAVIKGSLLSSFSSNGASITTGLKLGSLRVEGNVTGGSDPLGGGLFFDRPVNIVAQTIGSVTVLGNATYMNILAGYTTITTSVVPVDVPSGVAKIGKVKVVGDFNASNIIAGVKDPMNNGFGNGDEEVSFPKPDLFTSIAKVVIGGTVSGTDGRSSDFYGIEAELVKKVKIGGIIAALTNGPSNDQQIESPVGTIADFRIHETLLLG